MLRYRGNQVSNGDSVSVKEWTTCTGILKSVAIASATTSTARMAGDWHIEHKRKFSHIFLNESNEPKRVLSLRAEKSASHKILALWWWS